MPNGMLNYVGMCFIYTVNFIYLEHLSYITLTLHVKYVLALESRQTLAKDYLDKAFSPSIKT